MSFFYVYLACATALSWFAPHDQTPERFNTCVAVGSAAHSDGADVNLVVALSFTESRFNMGAISSAGAYGPLQVKPVFHCPGKRLEGCDLITAGLQALRKYRKKYGRWSEALCHWNSGNKCYRRSRLFARIVLKRRRALNRSHGDIDDG
jgi:soluble lytic murein transglycosylase-like protein